MTLPKHKNRDDAQPSAAQKSQSEKFKEAARELGAEDDPARFDEVMRRLAKRKPEPRKERKDKSSD